MHSLSTIDIEANLARQKNYESVYQSSDDPWDYDSYADQVRFQLICKTAQKWSPNAQRSLDVACGLGQMTFLLSEFSEEVFAYDFAPSAVQRTRERCSQIRNKKICIEVKDALNPNYPPASFDLILICDVANDGNLVWWNQVLTSHKELLAKDGKMLVAGRIKSRGRNDFEKTFLGFGGTIVDRIFFHDRYWYKARSALKRLLPGSYAKSLLAQGWLFHAMKAAGRLQGPNGSIHYGVVVQFP